MTFQAFYISVAVLLAATFLAAIILWICESRFNKKHPKGQNEIEAEKNTVRVGGEVVYLQVQDGNVTVIDELPTVEVQVGEPQVIEKIVEVEKVVTKEVPAEQVAAESAEIPTEDTEEFENSANLVSFERSESAQRLTFADKLATLSNEDRERYNKLVNYTLTKANAKHVITNNMAIFKIRTTRMMVVTVKRGVINLQFMLQNNAMEHTVRAGTIGKIKPNFPTMRLTDDDSLATAKGMVDITTDNIEGEREYYREQKREARREARAKAKEAAASEQN